MANQHSFGRRIGPREQPKPARNGVPVAIPKIKIEAAAAMTMPPQPAAPEYSPADQQHERSPTPSRSFAVPWRQLWLMASLSFGIGSLVLPDSVNDAVQWLLYALAAASLYAAFANRGKSNKPA